ncbi:hypothetical protein Dimus_026550 [Dionaea muscipula]
MATPSPAPSNSGGGGAASPIPTISTPNNNGAAASATESQTAPSTVKTAALPTIMLQRAEPPKTLRGLNKPKCIKCGNVARSRCPYQSCKSCCSKAQNPCHIHVLKPNATLADRSSSGTTLPDQPVNEVPSTGQQKTASVRQLSSNFAQFNNVNIPLRSRKPLTRKDALTINEWRFSKLKEFKERNIEAENEAFGRYMQNTSLLEEVFTVSSEDPPTADDKVGGTLGWKVKLKSNPMHTAKCRKRIQQLVDHGLKELKKRELKYGVNDVSDGAELSQSPKIPSKDSEVKTLAFQDLNDKLNKARNEDDLRSCMQMMPRIKSQQNNSERSRRVEEQNVEDDGSDASLLKLVKPCKIDQDTLSAIDVYFSSLEEIDDL